MSKERWEEIEGFEEYLVSDQGRVKSTARKDSRGNQLPERILKPFISKNKRALNGVLTVSLMRDGKKHNRSVGKLVASAFIGPSHFNIKHKDGHFDNNDLSNLEY